jgi:indolepyruvate ferredoxin oxidoreductase
MAGDDHISQEQHGRAPERPHLQGLRHFRCSSRASVQEILDMGLHAFAMSRFSGVWSGMKTIQEMVESSRHGDDRPRPREDRDARGLRDAAGRPAHPLARRAAGAGSAPDGLQVVRRAGLHPRQPAQLQRDRRPNDRFGIIASGKAYNDTRQALLDLGLDDDTCRQLGIRLHKVNVVWPLEATITREFATGLQEILVVEEKRQVIEYQLKEELYNWRADVRPNVLGKFDDPMATTRRRMVHAQPQPTLAAARQGRPDAGLIAKAIAKRLKKLGVPADIVARMDARLAVIEAKRDRALAELKVAGTGDRAALVLQRLPAQHQHPRARGLARRGRHRLPLHGIWMDRSTSTFTQMGGEGVPWVGQQPFTRDQHMFANLGDGTYFHSGILAIRQSIAAGVNITYKILYNDAVAMTGGQQVGERPEGHSVLQIMRSVRPRARPRSPSSPTSPRSTTAWPWPDGVAVHHRDELDAVQREFREIKGTTVIIYDQTCATEKRRRRKRGKLVDPASAWSSTSWCAKAAATAACSPTA